MQDILNDTSVETEQYRIIFCALLAFWRHHVEDPIQFSITEQTYMTPDSNICGVTLTVYLHLRLWTFTTRTRIYLPVELY